LHTKGATTAPVVAALASLGIPTPAGQDGALAIPPAALAMVDEVVARGRAARAVESATWPA
jgi:hypothetical protein